ncbi:hypothetical protein AMTR_s00131p00027400 [Amborella trichopoda]|uniref:Uncharacterized protein n=1 Tax=Amborella trichopoda TaxID=13333 RepID=W1NVU9_AMBTC|nr:hypothetical protein AMTR_s00131p00027400 [Amborella trichopoda]
MYLPVLIPVDQLPVLSQPPSGSTRDSSHLLTDKCDDHGVLIIFLSAAVSFLLLVLIYFVFLIYTKHKSKHVVLEGSSFESMFPSHRKKRDKVENLRPRTPKGKRLVEASYCFGKLVLYKKSKIIVATMDLSEDCRIGGSVYKATIDGKYFPVKQRRGHITKEINNANSVKLAGISMESEGKEREKLRRARVEFRVFENPKMDSSVFFFKSL